MPFVIRTYVGQDEWGQKKCLAHMNFGNDTYMSFFGPTEEAAKKAALDWYEVESKRWGKVDKAEALQELADTNEAIANSWGSFVETDDRHKMTGKIWMLNSSNEKKRVEASEVSSYEAQGWKRGGPRSVWKD